MARTQGRPETWGVGAQGRSLLSYTPRLAGFILRREQAEAHAASAGEAQKRPDADILASLTPKEQADARVFGLDYVARNRQREAERSFQEEQRNRALGAAEDAARRTADLRTAAREKTVAGVTERMAAAPSVEMPGGAARVAEALAAGLPMQTVVARISRETTRPIDDVTADIIEKELKIPLPAGFIRQSVFERRQGVERRDEASRLKEQTRTAARAQMRQMAQALLGEQATKEEVELVTGMIGAGEKPHTAAKTILGQRARKTEKEKSETAKAAADEEKKRTAGEKETFALTQQKLRIEREMAVTVRVKARWNPTTRAVDPASTVPKYSEAERQTMQAQIDAIDKRIADLTSGQSGNTEISGLLDKADAGTISPEEQQRLDLLIDARGTP